MKNQAEYIFYNGKVVSVDSQNQIFQALAIKENKILGIGTDEEIMKLQGKTTRKIDLEGRSLLPGFIDSHVHMAVYGTNLMGIDCRYPKVKSIEDIKKLISERVKETKKGEWIRCWGYDQSKLIEKRHPNRCDLDEVAPDNPVMMTRICAHISSNNSMSLKIAGIDEHSENPFGGEIVRENGIPNGVMKENAHMRMVKTAEFSEEDLAVAFKKANNDFIKLGITSLHDSGGYGNKQMKVMQQSVEKGEIDIRINAILFSFIDNIDFIKDYIKIGLHTNFGNEKLKLGPIKIMTDGSSSGPTAATKEPYTSDGEDYGSMSMTQEEINEIFLNANIAGYQVTAHAVGDRAVEQVVNGIEYALKKSPKKDHRHRIEHCAITDEGIIKRIKALGIIPVAQPIFFYEFGEGYLKNYGEKRVDRMFPCRTFLENDIFCAGSSDCPITFINPLWGIYAAINRITEDGTRISQKECVGIMEAIRMFTYNGAYASFDEKIKGSLEVGKLADLVVLSEDIFKIESEDIKKIRVDYTMIDGRIVYKRKIEDVLNFE